MIEAIKPSLREPFPPEREFYECPKTGLIIPMREIANLEYRHRLLAQADRDAGFQSDLMAACRESLMFYVNTFVWTYHQFDVDEGGDKAIAANAHCPFITFEVQEELLDQFIKCLGEGVIYGNSTEGLKAQDILVDKSRDLGASWLCIIFLDWLWRFRPDSQLLMLSRTEGYVDQAGNMKALFQKLDYIEEWMPEWLSPPDCKYGRRYRTKMHKLNHLNGSCIDGESTTEHAASGDRRLVVLLDEFSKVEKGALMRSATRDAALMRIVNSTGAGPGTEYSKWKRSGKIKVFQLPWWEHPDKGRGRYLIQDEVTGVWKIRSPWYDAESKVRSPKEMAREVDMIDMEAGSLRLTTENIIRHAALFGRDPDSRWDVKFRKGVSDDDVKDLLRRRDTAKVESRRTKSGSLRLWVHTVNGRPDQTKDYVFGIDISKGQGASNSVVSIKCRQTGEKIGEWRDANTPPYEMAKVVTALALWVGGRRKLPFLKWEMNGPGWDFGRVMVKTFLYPYYYRSRRTGDLKEKKTKMYGWHSNVKSKDVLMDEYDRALARGTYINHSLWALEEAQNYVYYDSGGCGPAELVEENASAKKTHGDCVIADALTVENSDMREGKLKEQDGPKTMRSAWYRRKVRQDKKKQRVSKFDFR